MRGVTAIFLGAVLIAFFLVLVAAMVWQEARRRPASEPAIYSLNDAAQSVRRRLPGELKETLTYDDVLRILEWQVHYLQQSVRGVEVGRGEVVVGATPQAIEYIRHKTLAVQGASYEVGHIEAVLAEQGAYLAEIGAIGEAAISTTGDRP